MGEDKKRRGKKSKKVHKSRYQFSRISCPCCLLKKMRNDSRLSRDQITNRALRDALHTEDAVKLTKLLKEGTGINSVLDEAFCDTPIMYAVKHTCLEILETLLAVPGCDIDCRDRNKHTPLDEAIKMWLMGGSLSENKQHRGRRFRVLRCVLAAGAQDMSVNFFDSLIYSCSNTKNGLADIEKLIRVVCARGHTKVKNTFLSILISHAKLAKFMQCLISTGADPSFIISTKMSCHHIPEENAVVIIKASNNWAILQLMEHYMNIPRPFDQRFYPRSITRNTIVPFLHYESIRLLLLSGYMLNLTTMEYLRKNQAGLYKMAAKNVQQPLPLKSMARVAVRKQCSPNVIVAIRNLKGIPHVDVLTGIFLALFIIHTPLFKDLTKNITDQAFIVFDSIGDRQIKPNMF